jgi:hypothetical protein
VRSHFLSMLFRVFVASSLAGVAAMAASSQTYSEQMTPASKERLYLEETVIQSPTDPAFKSYWSDQTDLIWWDSRKPVVRTGHVTDADGRRLVVTTIFAIPLCDISGCPVRIQTEQAEKLLDRVRACDLAEDHHLSADGRTFIACDERFPIPRRAAATSQSTSGAKTVPDYVSEPAPKQQLYIEERDIDSPKDRAFEAYWSNQSPDIIWDASPPLHHSISVGHFMDAGGRKLIVTTIYDPGECGMKGCPIRIFTESGDMLLDTIACNVNEFHRISPDRRYLIACGQAMRTPEAAQRAAEKAILIAAGPIAQSRVEKIPYDSGAELVSPTDYVFHEYWSDKTSQIAWKQPIAKRGMIYSWPLPSADGRHLFLTTLQSPPGTSCDSRCPVRVFTAQHKRIMDIIACGDRKQHGVSIDHRSFIACGESFPIPQVDDRAAIMENAPPDSNAEAYVEVVHRQQAKPANAPEPTRVGSAYHNNSEMLVSEWKDGSVEITYNHPRSGLAVAQGTLLFRGVRDGARYSGTAYTFKTGCPPAPYAVIGVKDSKKELIVMTGTAPRRDPISCDVTGDSAQSGSAKLVFDTRFYRDE